MADSRQYGSRPSIDDDGADENRPLLSSRNADPERQDGRRFGGAAAFLDRVVAPLKDPASLQPLEKVLAAIALLFILLFIIFVSLYAGAKSRLGSGRGPHDSIPAPGGEMVCMSPHCVMTASEVLRSIDTTVDPCDDFYHFSVGGWLNEHPIPADAGVYGMAQKIGEDNARLMRKFFEGSDDAKTAYTLAKKGDKVEERNVMKLRDFYRSCMNTNAQDKLGAKPLLKMTEQLKKHLIDAESSEQTLVQALSAQLAGSLAFELTNGVYIDQPVVPPNRPPSRHPPTKQPTPLPPRGGRQRSITDALAWSHAQGLPALFEWFVDGDPKKDPTLGTAYLGPSGLGFPDKVYYDDEDELKFYEKRISEAFSLLHEAEKKDSHRKDDDDQQKHIKQLAKLVVEFEKQLAAITPEGEDLEDPLATYNPTTLASLSYSFSGIDWPTYLAALTVRVPKSVIVQSPKFLKRLDALVSRTKTEVLGAYLAWTLVRTFGLQLGPNVALRKPVDLLERRAKGVDPDVKEDRGTACFAATNDALGYLAGHFYVQEAFSTRARTIASNIIDSIIAAFKTRLPELDWLDPKTRRKAEEKADAIRIKVGWPLSPNTTDAKAIEAYYADLTVDKTGYFDNVVRSTRRLNKRSWNSVGRKLDVERWDMIPSEVNAYYNPGGNEIVFPAGILQPSYFSEYWPSYMQYGAFGNVAGHELSHAFDPSGRLFDEKGRLNDWWTNETAEAFNERRDCLIAQYGNYTIPDGRGGVEHLRSRFTIGEDVADAGGIVQSFRAWKDSYGNGKSRTALDANPTLPGLQAYTHEQLFFVAFAIGWARNIRTQEAVRRLRTDEHSNTMYRVIGTLSNSPDFANAWGCKAGKDRMARSEEERCSIW